MRWRTRPTDHLRLTGARILAARHNALLRQEPLLPSVELRRACFPPSQSHLFNQRGSAPTLWAFFSDLLARALLASRRGASPRRPLRSDRMEPVRPDPVCPSQESVWAYPRPAVAEPTIRHVVVELGGTVIAVTHRAVRTLETSYRQATTFRQMTS